MPRDPKHFVQALARGLAVLRAFSAERPRLTLTELGEATGMNKAAVQRLTDTLMALGFLGRNRHKEFYLGPQVLGLGYAYLQGSELREMAKDHLRRFSEQVGHTVNLTVLDGQDVVVLYRREVRSFFKFDVQAGSRLPSHCTSMGKVLLAALPDPELRALLRRMRLESYTPYTITDRERLWEEVMETRRQGLGRSDREASLALFSHAAPLIDQRGRVIAAMNVSLFAEEASGPRLEQARRLLCEQGGQLSALLGYRGPYPVIPVGRAADDE